MMYLATAANVSSLDSNPISDLLSQETLDVSSLKEDAAHVPEKAFTGEVEEVDARSDELSQIEAFIAKHGVTKPTEEDYKPKSQRWSRNVKSKAEKLAENPNYIERRGRPRKTYTKDMNFVLLNTGGTEFKRAGRGRAKKGEIRECFTIHHTNIATVSEGVWTHDQLVAMANAS